MFIFRKEDLQPGMVVEYKNGYRRFVLGSGNKLVLSGMDGFLPLDDYDDELCYNVYPDYSIMKVYRTVGVAMLEKYLDDSSHLNLIWDRNESLKSILDQAAELDDIYKGMFGDMIDSITIEDDI